VTRWEWPGPKEHLDDTPWRQEESSPVDQNIVPVVYPEQLLLAHEWDPFFSVCGDCDFIYLDEYFLKDDEFHGSVSTTHNYVLRSVGE
jgi:hypothetical protein